MCLFGAYCGILLMEGSGSLSFGCLFWYLVAWSFSIVDLGFYLVLTFLFSFGLGCFLFGFGVFVVLFSLYLGYLWCFAVIWFCRSC